VHRLGRANPGIQNLRIIPSGVGMVAAATRAPLRTRFGHAAMKNDGERRERGSARKGSLAGETRTCGQRRKTTKSPWPALSRRLHAFASLMPDRLAPSPFRQKAPEEQWSRAGFCGVDQPEMTVNSRNQSERHIASQGRHRAESQVRSAAQFRLLIRRFRDRSLPDPTHPDPNMRLCLRGRRLDSKQHQLIMNLPVHSSQAIRSHSLDGGS